MLNTYVYLPFQLKYSTEWRRMIYQTPLRIFEIFVWKNAFTINLISWLTTLIFHNIYTQNMLWYYHNKNPQWLLKYNLFMINHEVLNWRGIENREKSLKNRPNVDSFYKKWVVSNGKRSIRSCSTTIQLRFAYLKVSLFQIFQKWISAS